MKYYILTLDICWSKYINCLQRRVLEFEYSVGVFVFVGIYEFSTLRTHNTIKY